MSHFTYMKTSFQNLFYLKKTLDKLNIKHGEKLEPVFPKPKKTEISNKNLVIPQSNGYNIEFAWNGQEYEFVADLSFWEQAFTMESFLDKIAQKYAGEVVIGEGQKTGFQVINTQPNSDGSITLVLERWKTKDLINF